MTTIPVSIRTPWNTKPIKSTPQTRRVLKNGRWVQTEADKKATQVLNYLKG